MSSSLSSQQPQQPGLVYPNTVPGQPTAASSSSHSDGSFGTVFIVLAGIIVISAIACCLGRLCNKRHRSHKEKSKQIRPKEKPGKDLEFGFDKNIAASKPAEIGESRVFKQFGNGDFRFEPKFADFGEPKASA